MNNTYHSPAEIIRQFLKDKGIGTLVDDDPKSKLWNMFVSFMPDGPKVEHDLITLNDTIGSDFGRIMKTGRYVSKPGVQIQVRAMDFNVGWRKLKEISCALDEAKDETVNITDKDAVVHNYTILTLSRTSPPAPIGTEQGTNRREMYTVNYLATLKEN